MGKNMEGAAPGLGEVEAASVLTPITQGSKGWSTPRVSDGQASTLMSKLQPSLTPPHHPVPPPGTFTPQQGAPSIQLWLTAWAQGYATPGEGQVTCLGWECCRPGCSCKGGKGELG